MADGPSLTLKGYRDFARTLRGLQLGPALKQAHDEVADAVVERAEAKGRRLGSVHAHVVRAGSIRAARTVSGATVRLGGAGRKHGPAFGAEFGAKRFPQFPWWRGNDTDAGYMVHPAIREMTASGELLDTWGRAIDKVLADAFPD